MFGKGKIDLNDSLQKLQTFKLVNLIGDKVVAL